MLSLSGSSHRKAQMMITITWQKSTADFTDDVAMNTSLAFSPAGQSAIAYLQAATHELKIAQLNDDGSWAITTVDTGLSGAGGTVA
jgi:outer membrane protein TolC